MSQPGEDGAYLQIRIQMFFGTTTENMSNKEPEIRGFFNWNKSRLQVCFSLGFHKDN